MIIYMILTLCGRNVTFGAVSISLAGGYSNTVQNVSQLEGTHRVRTHAVFLLTLTLTLTTSDLSTLKPCYF